MPDVRFGSKANIGHSFDHLVGEDEQLHRDVQSKCICSFTVEHRKKSGRLLDRKLARLCAFYKLVHVESCPTIEISETISITHQATGIDIFPLRKYGW
jgi:hypothetical protein